MLLKLIENKKIEETQVTVEYREKDEPVNKLVAFVEHHFRGKKYTQKLKEYQKRGDKDGK